MESRIEYALSLLSGEPLGAIRALDSQTLMKVDEIRLRISRPVSLTIDGEDILTDAVASPEDIEHTFKEAFSYSLHSYSKELTQGCVTTRGGNRVGVCGTAVISPENGAVDTVKCISSLNIRIAREAVGCAEDIAAECFGGGLSGLVVIGPPMSGKTTVLRDLCRILGNRCRISLIDELNEISASHRGIPQNGIGRFTDVFSGYPKKSGIETAVRVMSPRAILVDEIGSESDAEAILYALHSGVFPVTAVHAADIADARRKPAIDRLFSEDAFKNAVVLDQKRRRTVTRLV